ncbi:methyltransferase family protein [Streptococcus mutans]|uniref:methyltransferase family protein n=1 Tax=Streptococcus mutans TaxID=1309 RepID=UPI0038BAAD76
MTAFYLLVPFLFIRFIFLSLLDRKATGRAVYFASMQGKEIIAYYLYQLSTLMLLIVPFFLKVSLHFSSFLYLGLGAYLLGSVLLFLVIKDFANPDEKGLNTKGLYALSRHPMYIAYFVLFLGVAILTQSLTLLIFLAIFQLSDHFIILAEERECLIKFGAAYQEYQKRVRMYL